MLKRMHGPEKEPLTLEEAKRWLKVEHEEEDDIILSLITDAREFIERMTGRALLYQDWDLHLDAIGDVIEIPLVPLASVDGIFYMDDEGQEWPEPPSAYYVDEVSGRISLKNGERWEGTRYIRHIGGWRVRFTAGEESYPPWSIELTRRIMTARYENRERGLCPDVMEELLRHRVRRL